MSVVTDPGYQRERILPGLTGGKHSRYQDVRYQDAKPSHGEPATIIPLYKTGQKGREKVNWVCSMDPVTFNKLNNKVLYIGVDKCQLKECLTITQCINCLAFGHVKDKCKQIGETCRYCAEKGHSFDKCPNKDGKPKCITKCGKEVMDRHSGCAKGIGSLLA